MKTRRYLTIPVALASVLLSACKDIPSPPEDLEGQLILKSLDSLDVSFLQVACQYNGFPVYPPTPQYASIAGKLRVINFSRVSVADSIFLDHGHFFLRNGNQMLFDFDLIGVFWYGDTTLSARLEPGEIDSVWFVYGFDPALAPCQDSVYFDVVLRNSYGDSLLVRTPTVRFECSY